MQKQGALVAVVFMLLATVAAAAVDLEIDGKFDPCSFKTCSVDEECRVVDHEYLLEIPVAVCVKKDVRETEGTDKCESHSIGTNILKCKTLLQWKVIGQAQCAASNLKLDENSLQTKYICHKKFEGQLQYLSVDFKCCNKVTGTPSVLTVATPATTILSDRPKEDGWTAVGGASAATSSEETDKATSSNGIPTPVEIPIEDRYDPEEHGSPGTMSPATDEVDSSHDAIVDKEEQENDEDDTALIFAVASALAFCLVVLVGLGVYVRCMVASKHTKDGYKKSPTVLVNPNCEDYKAAFDVPTHKDNPIFKDDY